MRLSKILIIPLFLVTGCQTATEALDENDIRKTNLIEAECSIYFTVRAQMASLGQIANGNMTDGCPPSSKDIRADITPTNIIQEKDSRFSTIIHQRMIARGMPKEIASNVKKSRAFYDLVIQSDELYGPN